jgi:hypothetical protein
MKIPAPIGCLPKLYAHSEESGLTGRVLLFDLDTIVCGDMTPYFQWRGKFCSRADEVSLASGRPVSGGNLQSWEAGTTRHLWSEWSADPKAFAARVHGWERMAIRQMIPDQTFWQVELPGSMRHLRRELHGNSGGALIADGCAAIVATGPVRPHVMPDNALRREWEAADRTLRVRLVVATPDKDHNQLAPLRSRSFLAALDAAGVSIIDSDPDMDLVHCVGRETGRLFPAVPPVVNGHPVVVLEKVDGAQIHEGHRSWHPRVSAWLKGYRAEAPADLPMRHGRFHFADLAGSGDPDPGQDEAVDTVLGFGRYDRMRPLVDREPDYGAVRPVDVAFRGRLTYEARSGGGLVAAHRRAAVEAVRGLRGLVVDAGPSVGQTAYMESLYRTRIIVSPWGWGEPCYRDYEALLAGAVLVKPDCSYVRATVDIYGHDGPVVWCRPDWSDLPAAVDRALALSRDPAYLARARSLALLEWDDGVLARVVASRLWAAARKANIGGSAGRATIADIGALFPRRFSRAQPVRVRQNCRPGRIMARRLEPQPVASESAWDHAPWRGGSRRRRV